MLGKREAMRIKSDTLNILNTFVAQCSDYAPLFFFWKGVDWVGEESLGKDHRKSYMAACLSLRGRGDTHRKQLQSATDCLCTYG